MNFRIDDRDLSAFLVYAARERSLDASLRAANKYGRSDEHKKSIDALRELNKKMLFRETRRDATPSNAFRSLPPSSGDESSDSSSFSLRGRRLDDG